MRSDMAGLPGYVDPGYVTGDIVRTDGVTTLRSRHPLDLARDHCYVVDWSIQTAAAAVISLGINGRAAVSTRQYGFVTNAAVGGSRSNDNLVAFNGGAGIAAGTLTITRDPGGTVSAYGMARASDPSAFTAPSLNMIAWTWSEVDNVRSIEMNLSAVAMVAGSYMRIFRRTGLPL